MIFVGNMLEENCIKTLNIIVHILKYLNKVLAGVNKMISYLQSGLKYYFTCIFVFSPGGNVFLVWILFLWDSTYWVILLCMCAAPVGIEPVIYCGDQAPVFLSLEVAVLTTLDVCLHKNNSYRTPPSLTHTQSHTHTQRKQQNCLAFFHLTSSNVHLRFS